MRCRRRVVAARSHAAWPSHEHSLGCSSREDATNCAIAVYKMLLVRPLLHARAMRMLIGQRNMPRTFLIVILLALVVPSVARAQGNWLQKGVSGVGAEVGVAHQDGDTALVLTGAYSHQGFLDVLLTLGGHDTTVTD